MVKLPETVPTTLQAGRKFMVIGPHCWGCGLSPAEAEREAKKNRVRIYEGKGGWRFVLLDVPADAFVDGMGGICYVPLPEGQTTESAPAKELYRHNMPTKK